MGRKLVIIGVSGEVKDYRKIPWSDYQITASLGHIRDLPSKQPGS